MSLFAGIFAVMVYPLVAVGIALFIFGGLVSKYGNYTYRKDINSRANNSVLTADEIKHLIHNPQQTGRK